MSIQSRTEAVIRAALEPLGFRRYARSKVWHGRLGEVVLLASGSRSRFDDSVYLQVGLWHPRLSWRNDMAGSLRLLGEGVFGHVAPTGVGLQHGWPLADEAVCEAAVQCLRTQGCEWMAAFGNPEAVTGLTRDKTDVPADAWALEVLAGAPVLAHEPLGLAVHAWPVAEHRRMIREALGPSMREQGLAWMESERQVAFVRKRGDLWDVLEPRPSSNGVHTFFNWFVTTPRFWSMRSSLKELLVQTNGSELGLYGASDWMRCIRNDALALTEGTAVLMRAFTTQALPGYAAIGSRQQLLDSIGRGWESMAPALARAWRTP